MEEYQKLLKVTDRLVPGTKYETRTARLIHVQERHGIKKDDNGMVIGFTEKEPIGIYELDNGKVLEVKLKGLTPHHVFDLNRGKFFIEEDSVEKMEEST